MKSLPLRIAHQIKKYEELTGTILTLGTVESATGGSIGDKITGISGSSAYFKGSIVSYSNEIKSGIVRVKKSTLKSHGAVSYETGMEMANGGRKLLNVDICVADTGIAGPTGGSIQKPVGLFYIALSCSDGKQSCTEYHFEGNRDSIKNTAADTALKIVSEYLEERIKAVISGKFQQKQVVTSFIQNKGKILLVKRSSRVGTYKGRWSAISGYLETTPVEQAYREIEEETGLIKTGLVLIKRGKPLILYDDLLKTQWKIYPFLFKATTRSVSIDWENTEFKWLNPDAIDELPTVPSLKKAWHQVIK